MRAVRSQQHGRAVCGQQTPRTIKKRFLVTFCRLAKSYPPLAAEAFAPNKHNTQNSASQ
jgi:hypothetical protein